MRIKEKRELTTDQLFVTFFILIDIYFSLDIYRNHL